MNVCSIHVSIIHDAFCFMYILFGGCRICQTSTGARESTTVDCGVFWVWVIMTMDCQDVETGQSTFLQADGEQVHPCSCCVLRRDIQVLAE